MASFDRSKLNMMTIALPSELEEFVTAKIQSRQYHSAGEVIREGLRLLEEKDAPRQIKLEQLRRDIAVAVEAEEGGEVAPLDIEAIILEGKRRLKRVRHFSSPAKCVFG